MHSCLATFTLDENITVVTTTTADYYKMVNKRLHGRCRGRLQFLSLLPMYRRSPSLPLEAAIVAANHKLALVLGLMTANTSQAKTVGVVNVCFDLKKKKGTTSWRYVPNRTCFLFERKVFLWKVSFPGAHLARVWWAGNWCGKKRQMQYFFLFSFFSCRKCDMHTQRLWWSAENVESRRQSVPLQDLAGPFVRRGLLPSFLFQRVRVIAVVAVTLSFNSYLLALLSRENVVDNGCVLSSAQVLLFMFRVTHLVVFIAFLL